MKLHTKNFQINISYKKQKRNNLITASCEKYLLVLWGKNTHPPKQIEWKLPDTNLHTCVNLRRNTKLGLVEGMNILLVSFCSSMLCKLYLNMVQCPIIWGWGSNTTIDDKHINVYVMVLNH